MTSETSQTISINGANLSGSAGVESTTGGTNFLVDGAVYNVKLEYQDQYNNAAASTTNNGFTYDTTAPTLTPVHIQSNNSVNTRAATGDTVTLTFTSSEDLGATPAVTIRGSGGSMSGGPTAWTATYTLLVTDTEGVVPFTINYTDKAGNAGTQVTAVTDASSVTFDRTAPVLNYVHIQSNNTDTARAKTGDTITLSFTSPEDLTSKPVVTIAGHVIAAGNVTGGPASWSATYVMVGTDTEGTVPFTIDFTDIAGNPGTQVTTVTDSSTVTFDRTTPAAPLGLILATADDTGASNNDQITLNATALTVSGSAEANTTVRLYDDVMALIGTTTANGIGIWTVDVALGANATTNVTAKATDISGNESSSSTALPITVDTTGPAISGSTLAGNNGYIDITFGEGVYHSDFSALIKTDLDMVFAQNTGTATNVVISSVKKPDSATEGLASDLTAGVTQVRVFLTVTGTPNGNETINIFLRDDSAGTTTVYDVAGSGSGTGTSTGVKSLNPVSIVQFSATSSSGSEATSPGTFQITLTPAPSSDITVNYSIIGTGTYPATGSGIDFTDSTTSVVVTSGNGTANITVPVTGDTMDEYNEQFKVILGSGTGYAVGTNIEHTYTINDDDSEPTVHFTAALQSSAETNGAVMTVTAELTTASGKDVTVPYSITGTATLNTDYTITASPVTIPAGSTTASITITISGDTTDEANETVILTLGTPTNATASGTTVHTATINDDDNPPTVSINDVSLSEGNSGTKLFTFTVTLSAASEQTASLTYNINDGTATTADSDYADIVNGPLSFSPGEVSKNISVTVNGDAVNESDEAFTVVLSGLTNITAAGSDTSGTGTILNDDAVTPNVSFASASSSGSEGTTSATFNINITPAPTSSITVNYIIAGTGATAGVDFDNSTTSVVINAGQGTGTITVPVVNDSLDENDEGFTITLQDGTGYTHTGQDAHAYTILDNDAAPQVAFTASTSSTVNETTALNVEVSLSAVSGKNVTVVLTDSTPGGAGYALSGTDYTLSPVTGNTITVTAGNLTANAVLTPLHDTTNEAPYENVVLTIGTPTNSSLGAITIHTVHITDDDGTPSLSVNDISASENGGNFTLRIGCVATTCGSVSVNYSTSDGTATTSGSDYTAKSGTVTGGMWLGSAPNFYYDVTVTVNNDSVSEADETILFTLSGASGGTITDNVGTITILDDDVSVTILSAETLDCQGGRNGIIDHYKITFTGAVTDSTMDGYINNTTKGNPVTTWQVTGHSNVRFDPPGALDSNCGTDTENNNVIYLKFDEQLSANTGMLPDLTASSSTLSGGTGRIYNNSGNVLTGDVTETDKAGPYIWSAVAYDSGSNINSGKPAINDTMKVYFSESMSTVNLSGVDLDSEILLNNGHNFATSSNILSLAWGNYADTNDMLTITFADSATTVVPGDTITAIGTLIKDASNNVPGSNVISPPAITGTFDSGEVGPRVVSAEFMDTDFNGRLDHVKVTFDLNIFDTSIDGYVDTNTLGAVTAKWQVAGYNNVHVDPTLAEDVDNDKIVYFKFSEGLNYDTGSKPDVTSVSSTLKDNDGTYKCYIGQNVSDCQGSVSSGGNVSSIDIIERDAAKPVFVSATARVGDRYVFVFFSENVWSASGAPACGSGGELIQDSGSSTYDFSLTNGNSAGVATIESVDGTKNCASADKFVRLFADTDFVTGDMNSDVLKPYNGTSIYDSEGNAMSPTHSIKIQETVAPYVISASSFYDSTGVYGPSGTSWLRLVYSEPMHYERSVNASNYTLSVDKAGTCTTINANPISVRAISTSVFDLQTNAQCGDTIYKITVSSNVLDLNEIEPIGSPNVGTSYGTGSTDGTRPRLLQALSMDSYRIRITYSEPMKTGNVTGSAECASSGFPATCSTDVDGITGTQYLYTLTPSLGAITSVLKTSDPSIFDIIHSTPQTGSFYTVTAYASNAVTYIPEDLSGSLDLDIIPNNLATFRGQGEVIQIIEDGPLFTDPFADGSSFSFAFDFAGKVYLGPNDLNSGAYRFEPDGSNPLSITFLLVSGATTDIDFGITGTANAFSELGVSFFQSGVMKDQGTGLDKEFMFVAPIGSPKVNEVWYTSDIDSQLDFYKCAIGTSAGMQGAESITAIGKYMYLGIISNGTKRPVLKRFTVNDSTKACAEDGFDWNNNTQNIPAIGDNMGNTATIVGIDLIWNDGTTLFMGNNGGLVSATINDATNQPDADGDFTAVINETSACTSVPTNWCSGSNSNTLAINGLEKLAPGRKGLPFMVKYFDGTNTAYLLARNLTNGFAGTTRTGGELWKCTSGCTTTGNWTRVVSSKTGAGGSGMESPNNLAISMLKVSGTKVYIGFDNIIDGSRVYMTSAVPADKSSFTEVGRIASTTTNCANHSGDKGSLGGFCWGYQILSAATEDKQGHRYLYLTTGCRENTTDGGLCDADATVNGTFIAPPIRVLVEME